MSDQVPSNEHRHSLPIGYQVVKRSVLLKKEAALRQTSFLPQTCETEVEEDEDADEDEEEVN